MRNHEATATSMAFHSRKPLLLLVIHSQFSFPIRYTPWMKTAGRCLDNPVGSGYLS